MENVFGVTRATCVYHNSMFLMIRDKLGPAADQPDSMWPQMSRADGEFHRYLTSQGVDINTFINATQGWMAHFQTDTSGQAMSDYQSELHQLRMRRDARPSAAEYEHLSRKAQTDSRNRGANPEAIHGITKEILAEIMGKYSELKAKFGEAQAEGEFSQYLAGRGLSPYQWANANNAWLERFRADPTGRAEAEFHMMLAAQSQKAHFGDVRDMSQDTEEGITLDQYAQITVAVSRQGADADTIVRQFGLQGIEHWQRANAAWSAKMGADTTHKLTMQFGQLYQKHAGPQFQQEMLAQTADMLAEKNKPQDVVDEPEEELTPELCLRKMKSNSRNERWKYAYLYANMADLGNVPDKPQAIANVTPLLLEMLETHDDDTANNAEGAINKLWDLEVRTDEVKSAVVRCLNRAKDKLATLQAAFAPIQNQAVPERVFLQSKIQDFTSLVETMEDFASRDWSPVEAEAAAPEAPSFSVPMGKPATSHIPASLRAPSPGGGFPKWVLAPVAIVALGGAFFVLKSTVLKPKPEAAATPAAASATVASGVTPAANQAAAPAKPAAAAAPAAPKPAAATAASAPTAAKKKKGK